MKTIGITGGIGSGKSVVCEVFATLGIPIFHSDDMAKRVYSDFPEVKEMIAARFGADVYDGLQINRAKLASIVFTDSKSLADLNAIIHPFVRHQFETWKQKQRAPYVLREAAILLESGHYQDCNEIVLITAPLDVRLQRVMKRDGVDEVAVRARMSHQWTDEKRMPLVQHIIKNDDITAVIPQVLLLHQRWVV